MLMQLLALGRLTVQDPRRAASLLLSDERAQSAAMPGAILVSVLGVLFSWFSAVFLPADASDPIDQLLQNPLLLALIQFMLLMLSAIAIFVIGRMFGGSGSFEQSLLLFVWLQYVMLAVQILSFPIALGSIELATRLNMVLYLYFIWLSASFITTLHGFQSRLKVLAGMIATSFVASFVILILYSQFGPAIGTL